MFSAISKYLFVEAEFSWAEFKKLWSMFFPRLGFILPSLFTAILRIDLTS
jgi:hypothetical protein